MILLNGLASSIQSIIGATEIRRSSLLRGKSPDMPTSTGISESGVAAGSVGIPGSVSFGSWRERSGYGARYLASLFLDSLVRLIQGLQKCLIPVGHAGTGGRRRSG